MPHIGLEMERSLGVGGWKDAVVNLLARSAVAALDKRQSSETSGDSASDISGEISDAATAFSSWDNCMNANFCKWPAIALIAIGGLVIFSIVWCIVRCCCCGLSCCCQCCYCLKCCGECCGLCDPPRGKRNKYIDEPFVPPHHDQGYRSQAPMHPGFDSSKPTVPQYAEFDSGTKKDADSLPAMPTWEDANSKKVLVEEEAVEMEPLKKPDPSQASSLSTVAKSLHAASPSPISPSPRGMSPYGPPVGTGGPGGYMAATRNDGNPYSSSHQGYSGYDNYGYENQDSPTNMNDMAVVAPAGPLGRRPTPHRNYKPGYDQEDMDHGYSQYHPSQSPRPFNDEFGRSGTPTSSYDRTNPKSRGMPPNDGYARHQMSPGPRRGYGYDNPTRMGSPGAQPGYGFGNNHGHNGPRRSPGPQAGYGYPQRAKVQDEHTHHPYPAARRGYPANSQDDLAPVPVDSYTHPSPPISPIRNNSGFDFNSGYSRSDSRASPVPAGLTPAPPVHAPSLGSNGGSAYPGYRSYKPADVPNPQQQQHDWGPL
ncbi:hypothetical protein GGS20DRAFT_436406 [Poronia punctata]|nr:hypothetical protein GGS20DRAFT_436406 [Poronia punctata]